MSEEQKKPISEADAELEREIRRGRKFSLADAIGRLAGPGAMKGESPITRRQQAGLAIADHLRRLFSDAPGALCIALERRVKASELLLNNPEQPLVVLAACVQQILGSDYALRELVREADVEWSRIYGERPYFETEGAPPHANDPYTIDSVRGTLMQLLEKLATEAP